MQAEIVFKGTDDRTYDIRLIAETPPEKKILNDLHRGLTGTMPRGPRAAMLVKEGGQLDMQFGLSFQH